MKILRDRVALLTGASRGIGAYVAEALAREGARLALVARSRDQLDETAARVEAAGGVAVTLPADLLADGAVDHVLARTESALGPVDVLVNNAGIELIGPLHQVPFESVERVIRLNLLKTMELTRAVLPGMVERGRGHVVVMASLSGYAHPPFYEAYASSKAGLIAFAHSLRGSLQGTGVGASVVVPSFVSGVGMRRYTEEDDGVGIAPLAGGKPPDAVTRAVVRAIRTDRAEIIVAPWTARLVYRLVGGSPGLRQALMIGVSGVRRMYRRVVERRGGGGFTGSAG